MKNIKSLTPLFFKFDGSVAKSLGRESVSNSLIALIELVKNAYDADATEVIISFENIRLGNGKIKISDNGLGMNLYDLDQKFMTISTKDKVRNPVTQKYKRRKIGEKGIGRFAMEKLAKKVVIVSKPLGETNGYILKINWDEYEKDGVFADKVPNSAESFDKKKTEKGFEILLEDLREEWAEADVRDLRKDISVLLPLGIKENFSVRIIAPEFGKLSGLLKSSFLQSAIFTFSSKLQKNGVIKYSFRYLKKKKITDYGKLEKFSCGPVDFQLFFFYRDKGKYPDASIDINHIRKLLDEFGSIKLYRDKFRVKLQEEDWVGLDALRINDPSNYPGLNQVIGFVKIKRDENPHIIDTTTREGIIANEAYKNLIEFLHESIKKFVEKRKEIERDKKGIKKIVRKISPAGKKKVVKQITESFIDFSKKYPEVFYFTLEKEINSCYEYNLLNSCLILSRKMVENLVFNLLDVKFPKDINLRWNTPRNRPLDYSILVDNLKDNKNQFRQEETRLLNKFFTLETPFRRNANSKAHNIMEYLDEISQLNKLKIPEMIELLIKLIEKSKK